MARSPSTVCVYCSSSAGVADVHVEAARDIGRGLAERGDVLVWGGASVGLMGEVARAARGAGGRTIGVIPGSLFAKEVADHDAHELIVTEDMGTRKAEMAARADAFIALPGGFGTLEEVMEQITLRLLGVHDKPVVLVDIDGFWQPLLACFDEFRAQGFARDESRRAYAVVSTAAEALTLL